MVRATDSNKSKTTIKFLCSYGGRIQLRRSDGKIRYVGGFTRLLAVDRLIPYAELMVKLGEFCGYSVTLRCQLPSGDLETLILIKSDEELAYIIEEYELKFSNSPFPLQVKAVLSPPKSLEQISPPPSSIHSNASSVDFSSYNQQVPAGLYASRSRSPPVGLPVDAMKFQYYPRCVLVDSRLLSCWVRLCYHWR